MVRGLLRLLIGTTFLVSAGPAHATYCRAKACDYGDAPTLYDVWQEEPDLPCERDPYGCLLAGRPLYWPQTCLSFSVQKDGSESRGIDYETATQVIGGAFQTWRDAECPGGGTPSFAIADYGPVECSELEYNEWHANANVFMFRDSEWPHPGGGSTVALTTISYDTETGEIYDADVEINSAVNDLTVGDEYVDQDLAAAMTHEVGHFLGLSHNDNFDSVMWWQTAAGETRQRTLHEEDVAGICEIYPPDRSVDAQHCEPRHGFGTQCYPGDEPPKPAVGGGGCATSAGSLGSRELMTVVALLAVGLVARRRRGHFPAPS